MLLLKDLECSAVFKMHCRVMDFLSAEGTLRRNAVTFFGLIDSPSSSLRWGQTQICRQRCVKCFLLHSVCPWISLVTHSLSGPDVVYLAE